MKNIFIVLFVAFSVGVCALPSEASAYLSTGQSSFKLNEHTALFMIEYTFGHEKTDFYLPAVTVRNLPENTQSEKIGFEVVADGRVRTTKGSAYGAVLSSAPVVDGMYKLEKGVAQKLWLVVLYNTASDELETDYALQVTHLPFFADTGASEKDERQLNPSELQYYRTNEVELNTGNFN
jgi:hypothetical protein